MKNFENIPLGEADKKEELGEGSGLVDKEEGLNLNKVLEKEEDKNKEEEFKEGEDEIINNKKKNLKVGIKGINRKGDIELGRFCFHCGKQIKNSASFCGFCGKYLEMPREKYLDEFLKGEEVKVEMGKKTHEELIKIRPKIVERMVNFGIGDPEEEADKLISSLDAFNKSELRTFSLDYFMSLKKAAKNRIESDELLNKPENEELKEKLNYSLNYLTYEKFFDLMSRKIGKKGYLYADILKSVIDIIVIAHTKKDYLSGGLMIR